MAANPHRHDFEEDITVLVGKSEQSFILQRSLLCTSSEFFRLACVRDHEESGRSVIRLPEVHVDTFNTYIVWLHTKEIDILEGSEAKLPWTDEHGRTLLQRLPLDYRLIDCFSLGDDVQDASFRNSVIDEFIRLSEKDDTIPGLSSISYMCKKLSHDCRLVEVAADYYATHSDLYDFDKRLPRLPSSFVTAIARAAVRDRYRTLSERQPANREKCHYHDHVKGAACD